MAKRKAEAAAKQEAQVEQLPEARVISGGYSLFYADIVNVATSRDGEVAFTFYKTVPDPLTDTPKGTALHVQAIAQVPINLAVKLPGLIMSQITKGAPGTPPQIFEAAITIMERQVRELRVALRKAKATTGHVRKG